MMPDLSRNEFLVEEHSGLLQSAFDFDIRDPKTGEVLLLCREKEPRGFTRFLRYSELKRTTPFELRVTTPADQPVMTVSRGVPIMASRVRVTDDDGILIGGFKQKPFSIAGAFDVLDARGQRVCRLRGRSPGKEFDFVTDDDVVLAKVMKQWAGLRKELLTSADNYLLRVDSAVPDDGTIRRLILASALCIGMVVKFELP